MTRKIEKLLNQKDVLGVNYVRKKLGLQPYPVDKNNRKQWFHDRIGKRVYRNHNGCGCQTCWNVTQHGLVIQDEQHANYLYDVSSELGYKYYDEPQPKS